ncbi:glycosyltransferase family protein [Thiohalocapsa marina]|nr:glycosyltransferase [Thiohalocapsa marina]
MADHPEQRPLIIFHHPGPLTSNGRSGSQVRPWQLLNAFQQSTLDVISVVGYGTDRRRQIGIVRSALAAGRKISFIYSESRSIPTLLTERHRLPLFPTMDFRFLGAMRRAGIPVGLFYRDVFWRFPGYKRMLTRSARAVTVPLYWYDWWWYQHVVDHLFLPSTRMADHLPTPWPEERLSALPPGIPTVTTPPSDEGSHQRESIHLLYIGGTQPPHYDLTPLFATVRKQPCVHLTLCCRQNEWIKTRKNYSGLDSRRIDVVHRTGDELSALYAAADLFVIARGPDEYLDFAVPVKLFEAVGHGLPILTLAGTETARLVEQYDLGWVAETTDAVSGLIQRLRSNPSLLGEKRSAVRRVRGQHSWKARVQEIAKTLSSYNHLKHDT